MPPQLADEKFALAEAITFTYTSAVVSSVVVSAAAAVVSGGAAVVVAGATTAVAGGGVSASGGVGQIFSDGGTTVPLVFGVQRFTSASGLACATSAVHNDVRTSLGWASGDLGLAGGLGFDTTEDGEADAQAADGTTPTLVQRRRRRLSHHSAYTSDSANATNATILADAGLPRELVTLISILLTCVMALVLTLLVQMLLVQLWKHVINRRFYKHKKKGAKGTIAFVPFPKSLVWPNAFFFTMCVFGFGLSKAAVKLLASQPRNCDAGCYGLAIGVLVALLFIVAVAVADVASLLRTHKSVRWKPNAKVEAPDKVGDPIMRRIARIRVRLLAVVFVKRRLPGAASSSGSSSGGRSASSASFRGSRSRIGLPDEPSPSRAVLRRPLAAPPLAAPPLAAPPATAAEVATAAEAADTPAGLLYTKSCLSRTRGGLLRQVTFGAASEPPSVANASAATAHEPPLSPLEPPRSPHRLMLPPLSVSSSPDPASPSPLRNPSARGLASMHALPARPSRVAPQLQLGGTVQAALVAHHFQQRLQQQRLSSPIVLAPLGHRSPPSPTPSPPEQAATAEERAPWRPVCIPPPHLLPHGSSGSLSRPARLVRSMSGSFCHSSRLSEEYLKEKEVRTRSFAVGVGMRLSHWSRRSKARVAPAAGSDHPLPSKPPAEQPAMQLAGGVGWDPSSHRMAPPALGGTDDGDAPSAGVESAAPSEEHVSEEQLTTNRRSAMQLATERLKESGFRDRRSGAWALPEQDTAEPARTERILRDPFALRRDRPGDAFHQREGFLLFRVNGASRFGVCYRLLVIVVMLMIGIISGLRPLVGAAGSSAAIAQALVVAVLQLCMAAICLLYHPDADRVISVCCGTQVLIASDCF